MLNNFRSTESNKEIINILNESSCSMNKDFIWQSNDDERQLFYIEKLIINEKFQTFQAVLETDFFDSETLIQGRDVYVKLSYNDTVFKTRVLNLIGNVVSFYFPKELMTKEQRSNQRFKFNPYDKKHITIILNNEIMAGATQALKFIPVDISEGGVCLICDEKMYRMIKSNSFLQISKLQEVNLVDKVEACMVYGSKIKFKQNGRKVIGYRVGIKFLETMNKNNIKSFLNY